MGGAWPVPRTPCQHSVKSGGRRRRQPGGRGNVLRLIDRVSPLCGTQAAVQLIHYGQGWSDDGTKVEVTTGIRPGRVSKCCLLHVFMC